MSTRLVSVAFRPDGESIRVPMGTRLLKIVLDAGRPVGYSCRGRGVCTACVLWVTGPCSDVSEVEAELLAQCPSESARDDAVRRIACLARIMGDVEIQADYW